MVTTRTPDQIKSGLFLSPSLSPFMNVDGSVSEVNFDYAVDSNTLVIRIVGVIVGKNIHPKSFGGLEPLENGLLFQIFNENDEVILEFIGGGVKEVHEFSVLGILNVVTHKWDANDLFIFGFDFFSSGYFLELKKDWYMRFIVRDNLTDLDNFVASAIAISKE